MNYLVAKVRGVSEILKVLSTNDEIFSLPDLAQTQNYQPDYKLEEDEWFILDNFTGRSFFNPLISNNFNGTSLNQIITDQYSKVDYFCIKQDDIFLFQKITPPQIVKKKWFHISNAPIIENDSPIMVLNDFIDAVYSKVHDILYFRDIARIKPIFNGVEQLYREATQTEVDTFFQHEFITLENGYLSSSVGTANRKRIALAMDTFNSFTDEQKQQIFTYTQTYCTDIVCSENSFVISSEEQLKKVLFGIEQRYYTTPLGDEKRLANSILRLNV